MHYAQHLPFDQAYREGINAFHGRVFFEQFSPTTPQIWLTALEAIAGLIIEGVFIAMLIFSIISEKAVCVQFVHAIALCSLLYSHAKQPMTTYH